MTLEVFKQPAPRWLVYPLLVLIAAAAFSAGHFLGPERVEERVQFITVSHMVKVEAKARQRASYTKTVIAPDGTKTIERSTTDALRVDTTTKTDTSSSLLTEKRTTNRPDWRIGLQAGATWKTPALQLAGPLVLGVSVERRILGGVSLGAWGSTYGAAGASLSLEF